MNTAQSLVFNVLANKFSPIEPKLINLSATSTPENHARFLSTNKTVMAIVPCKSK